ncbi:MAG TPA: methyl-accepting chemotaxis protein [Novosphingobium sp.]|nr:methyl-accepting chemotaxis protein [Novosphingobium sp.]
MALRFPLGSFSRLPGLGQQTIAVRCRALGLVLIAIALAAVTVSLGIGNEIRIGGRLHAQERDYADLVADILPPPEYIIEPWLETTLIAQGEGSAADHLERLAALRRDYETRKAYWAAKDLPADLADSMRRANRQADAFWKVADDEFAPAVRAADRTRILAVHARLGTIYQAHRAEIDRLVTQANAATASLTDRSRHLVMVALAIIGGMAVLLIGAIAAGVAMLLRKGLAPLTETARVLGEGLDQLASGRIDHRITEPLPAEYLPLRNSFNATAEALSGLITALDGAATNIGSAGAQIREASTDLAERAEREAHGIHTAAQVIKDVTAMSGECWRSVEQVNAAVATTRSEAVEARGIVCATMSTMERIERSSKEIAKIADTVDGIAFQTNLLALNAGVEAARAGDAGKGFAVVAAEVRALAQRTTTAAQEIGRLLADSDQEVSLGVRNAASSEASFQAITAHVEQVSVMLGKVVDLARHQSSRLEEVNGSVREIEELTQHNAAMAEECSAASRAMTSESSTLLEIVDGFSQSRRGHTRQASGQQSDNGAGRALPRPGQAAPRPRLSAPGEPLAA